MPAMYPPRYVGKICLLCTHPGMYGVYTSPCVPSWVCAVSLLGYATLRITVVFVARPEEESPVLKVSRLPGGKNRLIQHKPARKSKETWHRESLFLSLPGMWRACFCCPPATYNDIACRYTPLEDCPTPSPGCLLPTNV